MEKINFNQVRGFSDSITLTFNFIKQEFKPLLRSFAVIALPVIFIGLFFIKPAQKNGFSVGAGKEVFALFGRPFVKPRCGKQTTPLEKVPSKHRLFGDGFAAGVDDYAFFVKFFVAPGENFGDNRSVFHHESGDAVGRENLAGM